MTPLAQTVMRELTLPKKRRTFEDNVGVLADLPRAHFFECTAVIDAAKEIAKTMDRPGGIPEDTSFLPAPVTWLEWQDIFFRKGLLLVEDGNGGAKASWVFGEWRNESFAPTSGGFQSLDGGYFWLLSGKERPAMPPIFRVYHERDFPLFVEQALLAMINTPRIIDRQQHPPHVGLQRKLARAKGMPGKFPLHGWTEVRLEVLAPRQDGDEGHEARLTGTKALHFCRSHLRIRLGRLEMVRAHWRGDPSVGIRRSRYVVGP
jgi:hypothetical protein